MMRHLAALLVIGIVAVGITAATQTEAQTTDPRDATIAALQTRVSALETVVAALVTPSAQVSPESAGATLTGTIHIEGTIGDLDFPTNDTCAGIGDWAALHVGTRIQVHDEAETLIGQGEIDQTEILDDGARHRSCDFSFTVSGLPETTFYAITIGEFAAITYSFDDLEAQDWHIELAPTGD